MGATRGSRGAHLVDEVEHVVGGVGGGGDGLADRGHLAAGEEADALEAGEDRGGGLVARARVYGCT
eukprot:5488205-Prymnesium_polylepis.1